MSVAQTPESHVIARSVPAHAPREGWPMTSATSHVLHALARSVVMRRHDNRLYESYLRPILGKKSTPLPRNESARTNT